jgi:membrane protein implicated in regulation of membrane protease activity
MEAFNEWWNGLSLVLKIYWGIAVPFTVFFVLQLILSFLGGDSPDDLPDAEVESDHGIGFQFFTLKNLVGFFTIFGWAGIACINAGWSVGASIFISTLSGLAMMGVMAGLFYLLMKASADGTMRFDKAIGQVGEVYLTIQSKRGGLGKVQVKVMGSLRTLDAMTDDESDIPTGKIVTVSSIAGDNILLVTSTSK